MIRTCLARRASACVVTLICGVACGAALRAQPQAVAADAAEETLHLYGLCGASPALREAAVAFEQMRNVHIEIASGPVSSWVGQARDDADFVYSCAEYTMTELTRHPELGVDRCTITPLYLRSSVVFVRPGNPHEIRDFPDLLAPGVRVMVVNTGGQAGLWEDMAGKLGDIRDLRALRKNITVFAASSDEAVKRWKADPDVDAWITWDIWFAPLHDRAELVEVSRPYRVYRQCNIALTTRGTAKPNAQAFIDFLVSDQGADIFDSWGWMTADRSPSPLAVREDICAVCRIKEDRWEAGVGQGLLQLQQLVEDYKALGVEPGDIHICAVFCQEASYWLLDDEAYARTAPDRGVNPNRQIVHELTQAGREHRAVQPGDGGARLDAQRPAAGREDRAGRRPAHHRPAAAGLCVSAVLGFARNAPGEHRNGVWP